MTHIYIAVHRSMSHYPADWLWHLPRAVGLERSTLRLQDCTQPHTDKRHDTTATAAPQLHSSTAPVVQWLAADAAQVEAQYLIE